MSEPPDRPRGPGILTGIRILCLAEQFPGPYATLVLSDHGADVVLVERPQGGDPARAFPAFFEALARGKRSLALDLKSEEGKARFLRLACSAHVLLEGYSPGTADRLGVGYEAIAAVNPGIVYVSISGFGQDGPYRNRPAHDLSFQAMAGLVDAVPPGEGSADPPRHCLADLSSGLHGAMAVLLGLFHRERTGQGLYVDVAMLEATLSLMTPRLIPALNGAASFEFLDEPAYRLFRTREGGTMSLSIAHEDHFWRELCRLTGLDDLSALEGPQRISRRAAIIPRLEAAIAEKTSAEWTGLFTASRIPHGPVMSAQEMATDPHVMARGVLVTVPNAVDGSPQYHMRQAMAVRGHLHEPHRPAPRLGEHTEEVLSDPAWNDSP